MTPGRYRFRCPFISLTSRSQTGILAERRGGDFGPYGGNVTDEEQHDRELIRQALTILNDINESDEPMPTAIGAMIGCAGSLAKGGELPGGELCQGAILCLFGERGSQTNRLVGAFNPIVAYGGLVDAMFEVRTATEIEATKETIQSFVGDAQAALADIEKQVTHPTDH